MIGDTYYKEISGAEFKMAKILNAFASLAIELCDYLSYKSEVHDEKHVISIKIDGKRYYEDKYRYLCNKMGIDINSLSRMYNFPKTVIIEITNYNLPYASLYSYFGDDECEEIDYKIGVSDTLESMVQDIKDYWRV